ncbi:hypothetical protein EC988_000483 [Linderina pennispora]|nr:hypothetical protein EC988_000483 [Linderina pennispora]
MPLQVGTWVCIQSRSREGYILYVSSAFRDILGYNPLDAIGKPASQFLDSDDFVVYNNLYLSGTPENIVVGYISLIWLDGTRLYLRTITFFCGEINFHVVSYNPQIINVASMERARTRRFNFSGSGGNMQAMLEQIQQAIGCNHDDHHGTVEVQHQPETRRLTTRPSIQACLVLDLVSRLREPMPLGPNVIFATNSIEQIIGVEATEFQGLPFLSAVAPADVTKAGEFLQNISTSNAIAFVTIRLLQNPLSEENPDGSQQVEVEIMGAGYDDGAILLCQPVQQHRLGDTQPSAGHPANYNDDTGYLSLEELISTDAETSGVDATWHDA